MSSAPDKPRPKVARAELILSRPDRFPLRTIMMQPDPLVDLVRAIGSADETANESLEVAIDLLPVKPSEQRRWSKAAHQTPNNGGGMAAVGSWDQVLDGIGASSGRSNGGRQQTRQRNPIEKYEEKVVDAKTVGAAQAFWIQVLIRAEAPDRGRAEALLQQAFAGFDVFAGENSFRAAGIRLGTGFLNGADSWWNRNLFDRRFATGEFRPRKRQICTVDELQGFLKPPTASSPAEFVARSPGVIPPPPRGLPDWKEGTKDLLPLGVVSTPKGELAKALYLKDTLFAYNAGRSGYGKTNMALGQFIAIALGGDGCMYLDPHGDAIDELKHYLSDVSHRVEEINLAADPSSLQAGWNPISMEGLARHDIETKVSAVVDSFAAALNWGEVNNRALTLTTMTVQSLCELSLLLPDEISPTIFQITTMLADDAWRSSVVPSLSPNLRAFWETRFPKLAADAITPVTNLVDRMRSSPTVAALFGASKSTYDIRRSMDTGRVVLWSTAGTGTWATLVNCFITHDLYRAAMSRRNITPDKRRRFFAFIDELQRISGRGSGSAGESVARALEEVRKMELRVMLMSQQPTRLAEPTREAIYTNRSHLASHVVSADSARQITREWGGGVAPETLTRLPKYEYVTQVTLNGNLTTPFRVRGFDVTELWAHKYTDDVGPLDLAVDENLRRRPVGDVIGELETLDERIIDALDHRPGSGADLLGDLSTNFDPQTRGSGSSTPFDQPVEAFDPQEIDDPTGVVTPMFPRNS